MSDWVEITVRWSNGESRTFRLVVPGPDAQPSPRVRSIRTQRPKQNIPDYTSRMPELVAEAKRLRSEGLRQADIADRLNAAGFTTLRGRPITQAVVSDMLRC